MALRVLLADESSTIKKVIQLALQDFAVEVKSVHSGVDVLEVAKSFKPDLIFADVLLQKRNGYEASAELKSAFETKNVPVILMWSSFMELDETAYQRSHADGRLEKPFDAETLRSLVTDLVPKARASMLSQHLEFPSSVFPREEAAPVPPPAPRTPVQQPPQQAAPPPSAGPQIIKQTPKPAPAKPAARQPEGPRSFELEPEDSAFSFSELPKAPPQTPAPPPKPQPTAQAVAPVAAPITPPPVQTPSQNVERPTRSWEDITMPRLDDGENWSHQNLQQFNVNLEPIKIESDNVSIEFDVQHGELEGEKRLLPRDSRDDQHEQREHHEQTISRTGYLAPQADETGVSPLLDAPDHHPHTEVGADGFSVLSSFETSDLEEMNIPRMSPTFDAPAPAFEERRSGAIPQLSADELERIVRAQSREIIEALVRKIVPDLASEMIREELKRLTDPN